MPPLVLVVLALAGAAAGAGVLVRKRRRVLARLRAEWGRPRVGEDRDDQADEFWGAVVRERRAPEDAQRALDDRTWTDLSLDDTLRHIDRSETTLGRQVMYARMRAGASDAPRVRTEQLAQVFARDARAREHAQVALARLGVATGRGFWRITRPGAIRVPAWYWVFPVLTLAIIAAIAAAFVWPRALVALVVFLVASISIRATISRQLIALRGAFQQIGPIVHAADILARHADCAAAAPATVAADVRALTRLARISRWMSREPLEVGELVSSLYEYINLALLADANALQFGAGALARHRDALVRVAEWVGEVDLALTIASLRAEPRVWCTPEFSDDGGATVMTDAWHPMLAAPVPNSVRIVPGAGLIITGSNMSGKSTFLRTVGVCAVLARALNVCPARAYHGARFAVRSCIGRTDDLAAGKSYYLAEVEAVLSMIAFAASRERGACLLLFDELFRGTNTVERLAAGEAVLRALLDVGEGEGAPRPSVMVATHDGELVAMLADLYAPVHFTETISSHGLSFDFTLREGAARTRSALALLELHGAPAALVEAARERARALDLETLAFRGGSRV